jgi:hypothetical protein
MVRTVLRNRPEDTGDLVELLDRTGILAASVPRYRRFEDVAAYTGESFEQYEFVVPSQGVGRSAVLGWVAGALMLVVAICGVQGFGQRGEPVDPVGGLAEEMPVSVPETQAPMPSAPAEPRPTTPEPEVVEPESQAAEPEPEPEPEPFVEQPRPEPEPISRPEARTDLPERVTETAPVLELPEQFRDVVEPAFEAFDSALAEMSGPGS